MRRLGKVLGVAALATSLGGCWIQPGFDAGRGNWNPDETAITPGNVDQLVELWAHDTGDLPVGAPLSVNGKVFAGVSNPAGQHQAVSLDGATGAVLWEGGRDSQGTTLHDPVYLDGNIMFPANIFKFGQISKVSAATGEDAGFVATNGVFSAAVADGELAFADGTYGSQVPSPIAARIKWRYSVTQLLLSNDPFRPSEHFAIVGDRILWGFGPQALGYAPCGAASCAEAWRTDLGGKPIGVAAVDSGYAVYVLDTGAVTVVDVVTGAIRWTSDVGAATAPAVAGGDIVVGTGDGRIVALEAASGAPLWDAAVGATVDRQPLVGGDVVYATAGSDLVVFDLSGCGAATCTSLTTIDVGAVVSGGPIVDDGRLVVGTDDGRIVAFGLSK